MYLMRLWIDGYGVWLECKEKDLDVNLNLDLFCSIKWGYMELFILVYIMYNSVVVLVFEWVNFLFRDSFKSKKVCFVIVFWVWSWL